MPMMAISRIPSSILSKVIVIIPTVRGYQEAIKLGAKAGRKTDILVEMLSLKQRRSLAKISQVTVTDDTLAVDLDDGRTIAAPLGWFLV